MPGSGTAVPPDELGTPPELPPEDVVVPPDEVVPPLLVPPHIAAPALWPQLQKWVWVRPAASAGLPLAAVRMAMAAATSERFMSQAPRQLNGQQGVKQEPDHIIYFINLANHAEKTAP